MSSSVPFSKTATGRRPRNPTSGDPGAAVCCPYGVCLPSSFSICCTVWQPAHSSDHRDVSPFPEKIHSLGLEARQEELAGGPLRGILREA